MMEKEYMGNFFRGELTAVKSKALILKFKKGDDRNFFDGKEFEDSCENWSWKNVI